MIFDNIKAVAKKRYPWLGICDVRSINFEDNIQFVHIVKK